MGGGSVAAGGSVGSAVGFITSVGIGSVGTTTVGMIGVGTGVSMAVVGIGVERVGIAPGCVGACEGTAVSSSDRFGRRVLIAVR